MTTQPEPAEYVVICKASDIAPGDSKMLMADGGPWRRKPMAVFNDNGTFYATNYVCPHMGGPLGDGTVEDGVVTCPWHAWTFDARTGEGLRASGHDITVYETTVEGDEVRVGAVKKG